MDTLKQQRENRRKNLASLIETSYKNQADFIRKTGINQGHVSGLLNGKKTFGEESARKIEAIAGLPPMFLDRIDAAESKPKSVDYALIPILDIRLACGNGYENGDNPEILGNWKMPLSFLHKLGVPPSKAEILFAHSYSMFPTIKNGSHVLINKADTVLRDGKIYAVNVNGEMLLKRLFHEGGNWVLRSDNPDKNEYPDRILPPEETTKVCGRVVWYDVSI